MRTWFRRPVAAKSGSWAAAIWPGRATTAAVYRIRPEDVVPERRLFRSTIRLFALLPIDYSDLTLVDVEPGIGFVEPSPMGSMRRWRHARRTEKDGSASVLVDELTFEPRFGGRAVARVIEFFFHGRHRNLRRHLGA